MSFIKTEGKVLYSPSPVEAFAQIPTGTWLLRQNPQTGEFYLQQTQEFSLPKKMYGNPEVLAQRYLKSFEVSDKNVGVLLTGTKGTGKSVLAKLICQMSEYPVISIAGEYDGNSLNSFFANVHQPVIVFIDEYEKVFNHQESQESLLSLFDGTNSGKKLWLLTSNRRDKVSEYMLNRPGRIRYIKHYDTLEQEIIDEIIDDTLVNKANRDDLNRVLSIINTVSMDIVTSRIHEMNVFDETAKESIKYMGIQPEGNHFTLKIYHPSGKLIGKTWPDKHPLIGDHHSFDLNITDPVVKKMLALEDIKDSYGEDSDAYKYVLANANKLVAQAKTSGVAVMEMGSEEMTEVDEAMEEFMGYVEGGDMYQDFEYNLTSSDVTHQDRIITVTDEEGYKYTFEPLVRTHGYDF